MILLAAIVVSGVVRLHLTKDFKLVIEKPQARTQRLEWQGQLTPADALGIERDFLRFGPSFYIEPSRDIPNAAQRQ